MTNLPLWPFSFCAVLSLAACSVSEVPIGPVEEAQLPVETRAVPVAEQAVAQWRDGTSCTELIGQAIEEDRAGKLASMAAVSPIGLLIDDGELNVIGDVPLPVASQKQAAIFDCLIVVGQAVAATSPPYEIVSERKLRSTYPIGEATARGMDRIEPAAGRTAPVERQAIAKTGDPTVDLVGVLAEGILSGIDTIFAPVESEQAYRQDTGTTKSPRQEPYSYRLSELRAKRSATVPVTLIDQRSQARRETDIRLSESQLFALSDDRHPQDPVRQHDPRARLVSTLQLQSWQNSPPSVAVSTILAHLQGQTAAKPNEVLTNPRRLFGASQLTPAHLTSDVEPALGTSTDQTTDAADRRNKDAIASVATENLLVRIGNGEHRAFGFYIGNEHLLVPQDALPITALVPIHFSDGAKVYGLVEQRDPETGLALIFSPRRGSPLTLSRHSSSLPSDRQDLVDGQPVLFGGEVAGLWLSNPNRFVSANHIAEFLARTQTADLSL